MTAVQEPPKLDVSTSEPSVDVDNDVDNYEDDDDFEKELESFIQKEEAKEKKVEEEEVIKELEEEKRRLEEEDGEERGDGDGEEDGEKGARDEETSEKDAPPAQPGSVEEDPYERPPSAGTGDEAESEPEDYNFTEDQRRAMEELMQQRQEAGDDPPEYDVKARLIELNAELAEEPDPDDRPSKVAFKENVVDFVAPAPDYPTDDDEHSQSQDSKAAKGKSTPSSEEGGDSADANSSQTTSPSPSPSPDPSSTASNTDSGKGEEKMVVERDGKFEVVAPEDMTPSERAIYLKQDDAATEKTSPKASKPKAQERSSPTPSPPPHPRPATASAHMQSRRGYRRSQSPQTQRPYSAAPHSTSNNLNENYKSPYSMSPEVKAEGQQRARLRERQRLEAERRKKEEKERAQRDSEDAFQAWLRQKREESRQRRQQQEDEERLKKEEEQGKRVHKENGYSVLESYTPLYQSKQSNEELFRAWLKTKKAQVRQEKLLKKRQEQEMRDGYYYHTKEDCDKAFREWLRKKQAEDKKNHAAEKRKAKVHRMLARRSKRAMAITRALQQAQSFRYVDYYGYRY